MLNKVIIMKEKFQAPRGTRDFLPEEMILREKVFETIKKVFQRWGFDPYKTPAFENYELFAMKESIGSGESEKLYVFEDKSGRKLALRFDQTVPFARQVASNPQLPKPIKRWEISRVWRYEEIKKGRYREFWQCDCDIVGSKSMLADAEVISIVLEALEELGFKDCYMRINNRILLSAIMEYVGIEKEKIIDTYRAIDKLDKIGEKGVEEELEERKIKKEVIGKLMNILKVSGNPEEVLSKISKTITSEKGKEGLKLLQELVGYLKDLGKENIVIDLSLVRGLDYYTSTIFEAMSANKSIGSLAGGGRYDKMIGAIAGTKEEIPAVGFGFGVERVIELLKESGFDRKKTLTKIFIANVHEEIKRDCLKIAQMLRKAGINAQTDIMGKTLKSQMEYTNSLGIPFVLIVGPQELKEGRFKLKEMTSGKEEYVSLEEVIKRMGQ